MYEFHDSCFKILEGEIKMAFEVMGVKIHPGMTPDQKRKALKKIARKYKKRRLKKQRKKQRQKQKQKQIITTTPGLSKFVEDKIPDKYKTGKTISDQPVIGVPTGTAILDDTKLEEAIDVAPNIKLKDDKKDKKYFMGVKPSPYLKKFGYKPDDPDYDIIKSDISSAKENIKSVVPTTLKNIKTTVGNIRDIKSNIKTIEASKPNTKWTITDDLGTREQLSRDEAITVLKGKLPEQFKGLTGQFKTLTGASALGKQYKDLRTLEKTVEAYEKGGYEVDIKKDDSYKFKLPKASKVHSWLVKDPEKEKILLTSASFMESPLAIGTMIDMGASAITGDKGYSERRKEKHAEYSLGLQKSLMKDDYGGYALKQEWI